MKMKVFLETVVALDDLNPAPDDMTVMEWTEQSHVKGLITHDEAMEINRSLFKCSGAGRCAYRCRKELEVGGRYYHV